MLREGAYVMKEVAFVALFLSFVACVVYIVYRASIADDDDDQWPTGGGCVAV